MTDNAETAGGLKVHKAETISYKRGYAVKMFGHLDKYDCHVLAETLIRLTEPGRVLWMAPDRTSRILQNDLKGLIQRGCTLVLYPETPGMTTLDLKEEISGTIDAMKPAPAVLVFDNRGYRSETTPHTWCRRADCCQADGPAGRRDTGPAMTWRESDMTVITTCRGMLDTGRRCYARIEVDLSNPRPLCPFCAPNEKRPPTVDAARGARVSNRNSTQNGKDYA